MKGGLIWLEELMGFLRSLRPLPPEELRDDNNGSFADFSGQVRFILFFSASFFFFCLAAVL